MEDIIRAKAVERKELGRLVGRFSLDQTNVFCKFDRPFPQELYDRLHDKTYVSSRDDYFLPSLNWRLSALKSGISTIVPIMPKYPKYILYTDASWSGKKYSGRIAAISVDRRSGAVLEVLSSAAPLSLAHLFKTSLAIYGLELFALVAALAAWQRILHHSCVTDYVDNDPSSNGLIRGSSKFSISHNMILRFW